MIFYWRKPGDNGGNYYFRIYEPAFFTFVYSSETTASPKPEEGYYCYEEITMPVSKDIDGDKQNELILFSSLKETDAKITVLKFGVKGKK